MSELLYTLKVLVLTAGLPVLVLGTLLYVAGPQRRRDPVLLALFFLGVILSVSGGD